MITLREMVKGGYTPGVFGHLGVQGKHVRGTCPRLPQNALKFNFDARARHPQPMPSIHTFSFLFVGHGIEANGAAAKEGAT